MGTNTPRRKSWTRKHLIPGTVIDDESLTSIPVSLVSVDVLPQTSSSEYQPHELNHSDASKIHALEKKIQNDLESSYQSVQSRLSIKQNKDMDKNKETNKYTYNNYYINSGSKDDHQQNCCSKFLKLLTQHTFNILYGVLGSIVASALT